MIDAKQAAKLLAQHWIDPSLLARELYSLATSKQDRTLEAPLTIRVPVGRTALRIVVGPPSAPEPKAAPPAARQAPPRPTAQADTPNRPATPETPSRSLASNILSLLQPGRSQPQTDQPPARPPFSPVQEPASIRLPGDEPPVSKKGQLGTREADGLPPKVPEAIARAAEARGARQSLDARFPVVGGPTSSGGGGDSGYGGFGAKGPAPDGEILDRPAAGFHSISPFKQATTYRTPTFEIVGAVSISPGVPVQFEVEPTVWSPRAKEYRPISEWQTEESVHIKRGRLNFDPQIGKVAGTVATTGGFWPVKIYPEGYDNAVSPKQETFTASVRVIGASAGDSIPNGTWIGPIYQTPAQDGADANEYVYFLPNGQHAVAKVTTEVAKATSITRPGKGKIQLYTAIDMTTTPATLSTLTGVDENCCSINQEKKIAVNSAVIAVKFLGVWFVTTPDSCASLL